MARYVQEDNIERIADALEQIAAILAIRAEHDIEQGGASSGSIKVLRQIVADFKG